MTQANELHDLFETIAEALSAAEPQRLVDRWALPALFLSDDGALVLSDTAQVRDVFERAVAAYRERGIAATRPEILATERAGGRLLLVTVRWPYLDAAGTAKGDEVSRYVVWLDGDGTPRIRVGMSWG